MLRIVNLTPHALTLVVDGLAVEISPEPTPARVSSTPGAQLLSGGCSCSDDPNCECCHGTREIPLTAGGAALMAAPTWGEVEGLPAPQKGTIYVVSSLVASRCAGRRDVFSPGTGPNDECVRDERGRITGITRLIQAPRSDEKSELLRVLRGLEHDARETGLNSQYLEDAASILEKEE